MQNTAKSEITKSAMSSSMKKLILTKPINKITINDITSDCGLNRQTFYYHFKDIYDLFEWTFNKEIESLGTTLTSPDISWEEVLSEFINYLQKNKYICRCALNGLGREQLIGHLHGTAYEIIRHIVIHMHAGDGTPEKYLDFSARFYTYAFGSYIFDWIKDGMKESPEEIIDLFKYIINRQMGE